MPIQKRLRGLDGLRGIAVLAVMAYHYDEQRAHYGLLGVEMFFVISGFVILMTMEKTNSLFAFVWHRAARLYPAYLLSVGLAGSILLMQHQTTLPIVAVNAT